MKTRTITVWDAKTDLPEPYKCVVVEDVVPGVGHVCALTYYDPERGLAGSASSENNPAS